MRFPLLLAILLAACAPTRDEGEGTAPIGNDYESALFTIEQQGDGAFYELGHLVLVNADMDCGDLSWSGDLETWSLDQDVEYMNLWIQHGVALDGWLRDYISAQRWSDEGNEWTDEMHHFWGQQGLGDGGGELPPDGGEVPPDDDEEPPPPEGREVLMTIGNDSNGTDHLLSVLEADADHLAGQIDLNDESVSFSATKCETIVREDVPVPG